MTHKSHGSISALLTVAVMGVLLMGLTAGGILTSRKTNPFIRANPSLGCISDWQPQEGTGCTAEVSGWWYDSTIGECRSYLGMSCSAPPYNTKEICETACTQGSVDCPKLCSGTDANGTCQEEKFFICHHNPDQNVQLSFNNLGSCRGHFKDPHNDRVYDAPGRCGEADLSPIPSSSLTPEPSSDIHPTDLLTPTDIPTPIDIPTSTTVPDHSITATSVPPNPTGTRAPSVPSETPMSYPTDTPVPPSPTDFASVPSDTPIPPFQPAGTCRCVLSQVLSNDCDPDAMQVPACSGISGCECLPASPTPLPVCPPSCKDANSSYTGPDRLWHGEGTGGDADCTSQIEALPPNQGRADNNDYAIWVSQYIVYSNGGFIPAGDRVADFDCNPSDSRTWGVSLNDYAIWLTNSGIK